MTLESQKKLITATLIKLLYENGIRVKEFCQYIQNDDKGVAFLQMWKECQYSELITQAFVWSKTPQDSDFWLGLNEQFREKIEDIGL